MLGDRDRMGTGRTASTLIRPRRIRRRSIAATNDMYRITTSSLAILCLAAPSAHAQSAQAEALFDDGNKLMAAGKLPEACGAFFESNRIEARAGTLIRLGECREANHQLASAWSAYKDALGRAKDPVKVKLARDRVTALEPRLSYLTVTVAPAARVAGLAISRDGAPIDEGLFGHALPIDGGDYTIVARAPDHEEWSAVAHVPIEAGKVQIDVPPLKESKPAPVAVAPVPAPVQPVPPPVVPASPGILSARRDVALGVGGAAILALGVGVAAGLSAKSQESSGLDECGTMTGPCKPGGDPVKANHELATARSRATDANFAFGAAAVLAVGAGVLWATGAPHAERIAVAPSVAPGQAGLVVVGVFR